MRTGLIALLFAALSFNQNLLATELNDQPQGSQQNAARLWEQAITAKGGRERLHAVRNIYMIRQLACTSCAEDSLFVLPNKLWKFLYGPYQGGVRKEISTCNFEPMSCWYVNQNLQSALQLTTGASAEHEKEIISVQWLYLMESN